MCGIWGYVNYGDRLNENQIAEIYTAFSNVCITRGKHACGIAYVSGGVLSVKKAPTDLVSANFSYPANVKMLMAHCRLSLQKNYSNNNNNHPFCGQTFDGVKYAVEHNGILRDLRKIRRQFHLAKTEISTDSYLIAQILNTKSRLNLQTLKEVCETLRGSFSFTVLDEKNNFYVCRGDVPIYIIHFKKLKLYLYISTRDLFEQAAATTDLWFDYKSSNLELSAGSVNLVPTNKGTILQISPDGNLARETFIFQEEKAIRHNWYMHEITKTEELQQQLANLENE
ncbi:MAG: hypothetical protein LBT05_09950 [Planctomycetaceae bacterium]|jgi:glucosamine 6-phosphate synthetase-like amidotransferase/phosphosugar isomerase protein|nr:hypothetical protein [Planctomycetaceae bacterium]